MRKFWTCGRYYDPSYRSISFTFYLLTKKSPRTFGARGFFVV